MEDEIIIHRQIINHYSRPDLAPQLWNYSSTLANNNNRLYWVEQGEEEGAKGKTVKEGLKGKRGRKERGKYHVAVALWRRTVSMPDEFIILQIQQQKKPSWLPFLL